MPRLTKKAVLKAIDGSHGIIATVARRLGVARSTVYRFMERVPECRDAMEEAKAVMLDDAEGVLYRKAILEGDTTSLIFLLKTVGKHRGYSERIEQRQVDKDGEDVRQVIVIAGQEVEF